MAVNPFRSVQNILQPLRRFNPTLVEAIILLARGSEHEQARTDLNESVDRNFPIRFELPGVRAVDTDILPARYTVRLPRYSFNNSVIPARIDLKYLSLSAKVMAAITDYQVDILVSTDRGVTFKSLFGTDPTILDKPKIPVNIPLITYSQFSIDSLFDGDMLRVDDLAADGTIDGVEIYLLGQLITQ